MIESLLTISVIGLAVGLTFSVPVAGPISILIASHALKGEGRYCIRVAVGAAISDFFYCFIAVFGFTHLYLRYERFIPYFLIAGSLFIFYYGTKILRTRLVLEKLDSKGKVNPLRAELEQKGGFRAGIVLNFLNPSLFIGWLTSSFLVISLAASLGFNVAQLNNILNSDVKTFQNHSLPNGVNSGMDPYAGLLDASKALQPEPSASGTSTVSRLVYSLVYALFVALGTIVWFYYFSRFLIRNRKRVNVKILNHIIQILGVVLCFLSVYLIYIAARIFLS
jgi:threonine/homoserine/homoserine lactone efflux protein